MGLKFSHSFEFAEQNRGVEREYLERVGHDLEIEVERILAHESKIGEGKTARVFSISATRLPIPACIKIWKPDVLKLQEKNIVDYHKMQYGTPEEEFDLQDNLYLDGFRKMPRPIAFERMGGYQAMVMEELPGYTLEEIESIGGSIEKPTWKELESLIFDLNMKHYVIHRDLGKQNIFIKTNDRLADNAKINGEIYLIDFGLSKQISSTPDPEDFVLGTHIWRTSF